MAIKYENFAFTLEGLSYIPQQINFTKKNYYYFIKIQIIIPGNILMQCGYSLPISLSQTILSNFLYISNRDVFKWGLWKVRENRVKKNQYILIVFQLSFWCCEASRYFSLSSLPLPRDNETLSYKVEIPNTGSLHWKCSIMTIWGCTNNATQ